MDQPVEPEITDEQPLVTPEAPTAPAEPSGASALVTPAAESTPAPAAPDAGGGRGRRTMWVVLAVLGVALLVAFGLLGYQSFAKRLSAAKQLDQATTLVEEADVVVVKVDGVVRAKVTPELATSATEAQAQVPAAAADLDRAVKLIDGAYEDLTDDERERATLLKAAAEARIKMLAAAPEVLGFNIKAAESLTSGRAAWDKVIAADKLSDSAVASYNKLTKVGVTESGKLNKRAAEELTASRSRFEEAERAFPEAPFELYLAYVDTRMRLNKLSQQSDAAWLGGQLAKANTLINTYNVEDKKAVAQAKGLPESPERAIADAYEKAVKASTDAYYAARDEATKADDELRTF